MRKLGGSLIITIGVLIFINFYFLSPEQDKVIEEVKDPVVEKIVDEIEVSQPNNRLLNEGLHTFIGQSASLVEETFGLPDRIDPSAYDYQWWVYQSLENGYLLIGIENRIVVTAYYVGDDDLTEPFTIGTSYEQLNTEYIFQDHVSFNLGRNSYQFLLNSEELLSRPLIQIDDFFVQLYFDTYTNQLSSVRYLDIDTVVKQRPYSVEYRGKLIEPLPLSSQEWEKVERGSALQVLNITNQLRKRHQLSEVKWHDETAKVAYAHSKDMMINEYFSHTSPQHGELEDRLNKENILYEFAGENIAANYVDSISAVEGWLNSEGHRAILLHEELTHLGVGVYQKYYTQNFITPW